MRRTTWTTVLAWVAGFCMAAGIASATTLRDTWQQFGEYFQLGYVVGYLDAVKLNHLGDPRANLPTTSRVDFERWRRLVNDYFADPKNANRAVPDAMAAAGKIITEEMLADLKRRRMQGQASPSPAAASPSSPPARSP